MSLGVWEMGEAISDTGPILHLHEIDRLYALNVFNGLFIPTLVADELRVWGLNISNLGISAGISVMTVDSGRRVEVLEDVSNSPIQPADAEVLILAEDDGFKKPVLTDDMRLRKRLESRGALVVGSVGVLFRAYHIGMLERNELDMAVVALFEESTLHLSPAFRAYVREFLTDLV